jgi:L-lactate utilization protein LutC
VVERRKGEEGEWQPEDDVSGDRRERPLRTQKTMLAPAHCTITTSGVVVMTQTVVGVFHSISDAQRAADRLAQ